MPAKPSKFSLKLLREYPNRFLFILFPMGYAGHSVQRLFMADEKYFNYVYPEHPLHYPELTEGFPSEAWDDTNGTQELFQQLGSAHFGGSYQKILHSADTPDCAKDVLENIRDTDQIFTLHHHNPIMAEWFPEIKSVWCYGYNLRPTKVINKVFDDVKEKVPPIDRKNVYNINVNNLFSKEYDSCLEEYLKLVREFDLTPRCNTFRSFVLLWLEKQQRVNEILLNA